MFSSVLFFLDLSVKLTKHDWYLSQLTRVANSHSKMVLSYTMDLPHIWCIVEDHIGVWLFSPLKISFFLFYFTSTLFPKSKDSFWTHISFVSASHWFSYDCQINWQEQSPQPCRASLLSGKLKLLAWQWIIWSQREKKAFDCGLSRVKKKYGNEHEYNVLETVWQQWRLQRTWFA